MSNSNRFAVLAQLGGGMPPPKKPKVDALFGGKYSGHQLGQMRKKLTELYPDHPHNKRASPEMEGRALKGLGKALGNKSYVDAGRKLQYGNLSPEELLLKHPSAFLRQYTIRAGFLQQPDDSLRSKNAKTGFNETATASKKFHLVASKSSKSIGIPSVEKDTIFDVSSGWTHKRKQDFNLVQISRKKDVEKVFGADKVQFGPEIEGGFLPMVQSKFGTLTSTPSNKNVKAFKRGELGLGSLKQPSNPVFTTELTGCSIVRLKNSVAHIRPGDAGGEALQSSFTPGQSYGRKDYLDADNSFVMLRKKPDGRTKLYYQTHHYDESSRSGSRYLEPPKK